MPRALWVKAPFVLGRHRSVLLAVVCASFLVALAAASAPLLRAGAESEALKGKLQQLSPLAAGLTIETRGARDRNIAAGDQARRAAVVRLARSLPFVEEPLLTTITSAEVSASTRNGGLPAEVVPMARTGAMAHVHRLSGNGQGAWVAATVARLAGLRPGGQIGLVEFAATGVRIHRVPVGAVYLPLDQDLDNPNWVDFLTRIRARNPDARPLPTFLLMNQAELYRTARLAGGGFVANVFELPIAAGSVTPARAKEIAKRFAAVRHGLSRPTPLARELGCPCRSSSSIEAAVTLAGRSVAALTPVVSLLAGFAAVMAIGAAFVAGVFNTRRRSAEARLSVVGGEPRAVFGLRLVLEAFLPSLAGAAAGVLVAVGLTRELTPKGTIDNSVLHSAVAASGGAVAVAIAAIALGGVAARGPAIERMRGRSVLLRVPWELPVLIAAAISYVFVEHGGGLVKDATIGAHPRLIVLLFPLLLAAGIAGVAARAARWAVRRRAIASDIIFLALRRLAAARALLVLLTVTAAVAAAAVTFAEVLRSSLDSNSSEKAYVANGADVQGLIDPVKVVQPSFPFPATKVEESFDNATLSDGTHVELLVIDPLALRDVMRWPWAGDPRGALERLETSRDSLPAIAVAASGRPDAIWLAGKRIAVHVVATSAAFPGMTAGEPMIVVAADRLARAAAAAGVESPTAGAYAYVWARGDPRSIETALASSSLAPSFFTTVDHFLLNADLTTASRTYAFLRVIALGAALIAFTALILYLYARGRSQLVTSAFLVRMGLGRSRQAASVALEAAALVAFAVTVGAGSALLAASPVVSRVDPLPLYPPPSTLVVPWLELGWSLCLLVIVAAVAGAAASALTAQSELGEALRVA
ncbi:MAG: hypothetical protein WAU41_16670 [Gaiellaceae bacterium]